MVHESFRFLQRVQGGPSSRLHLIFCFLQAAHAVILRVISGAPLLEGTLPSGGGPFPVLDMLGPFSFFLRHVGDVTRV